MKLGAESRTKTLLAVLLMAAAVWAVLHTFSGTPTATPTPATPTPAARAAAPAAPRPAAQQPPRRTGREQRRWTYALQPSLDPRLRLDLVQETESTTYSGRGRNIFKAQAEPAPEIAVAQQRPAKQEPPPRWTPPPVAPPPPIDLKFYGWASSPGEPKRIFLSQQGSVFVAGEGDVIARRYRIVRIHQTSVEVEDVLSNNRQTIPLTQG